MGKASDFKFGVRVDRQAYKPKNAKWGQEGRDLRHVTYFYNFVTPCISLEWVKLDTSNLVCGLIARSISQKMQNEVKTGVTYVTRPTFIILGPAVYFRNG